MYSLLLFVMGCADDPKVDDTSAPEESEPVDSEPTVTTPVDADGDGFPVEDDCDDGDAAVHPDAVETCNGIDDDCDGVADGADALGGSTWYADADGDGYGDATATTTACSAPGGYVSDATDCDDFLAAVSPGEREVCGDGLDNDCVASDEACRFEGEISLSEADTVVNSERGTTGYSGSSIDLGDLDGDGRADLVVNAASIVDGLIRPSILVISEPPAGVLSPTDATAQLFVGPGEYYVVGATAPGDLGGDGNPDLVVVWPYNDDLYSGGGVAYLVDGPFVGDVDVANVARATIYGPAEDLYLGSVVTGGDVDGDGTVDILLGTDLSPALYKSNVAYLFDGRVSGTVDPSDAKIQFGSHLTTEGEFCVLTYASGEMGDTNGDGLDDILIGNNDCTDPSDPGQVLLFRDPELGVVDLTSADAVVEGATEFSLLGGVPYSIAGDLTGDGLADVAIRIHSERDASDVDHLRGLRLFDGSMSGAVSMEGGFAELMAGDDLRSENVGLGSGDGEGGIAAEDADGDGWRDLLVGGPNYDQSVEDDYAGIGAAFLVYGPFAGVVDVWAGGAAFTGVYLGDAAGGSVAMGDVDADGLADLFIGATGVEVDYAATYGEGAAYLLYSSGQ